LEVDYFPSFDQTGILNLPPAISVTFGRNIRRSQLALFQRMARNAPFGDHPG